MSEGKEPDTYGESYSSKMLVQMTYCHIAQPSKNAAHRDTSREWKVSKQKRNLCQLQEQWKMARFPAQEVTETDRFRS